MTVFPGSPTLPHTEPSAPGYLPLAGRVVMVTGVSRRAGIGYAIACRAAHMGASLFLQHFCPHDAAQPWGADDVACVVEAVRGHLVGQARLAHASADLADPEAPAALVAQAVSELGGLDALVCNHAASGRDGTLAEVTAADLDHHWQVNARSSLLLVQALAEYQRGAGRGLALPSPPGRFHPLTAPGLAEDHPAPRPQLSTAVVLMTSGQGEGPMPSEIAYATSKAALAGITPSLAAGLAEDGIRLNTVNPGPVDTGYMSPELIAALTPRFPGGRMPATADPARLITWLLTDDAAWVTGQVIATEGGFRRS
ncbi:MAG: SDR family oxidoreductase [Actinomyces urogenitalis]|uniref:SDR family oxidoreductase n=1 Tax=Actinomyces urogenitalis TaxID=103621 RepID=UPI002A828DC5|nr:SDR family oxidoreductase [Actinomyces urogenitalis]MDY3678785.1 SDR family oxidoreductase [Actinomyces urogenitalis]